MNCEYEFCIYNKDKKCRLDKIAVNHLGMCDDYCSVMLDKDYLDNEKERQFGEYENRFDD
ncbi:MAG: hypothetical protein FWE90_09525 [Defluviitaleaceae bacterium]|nr:hypothetical protein [Defluviitaleaceae bacterium]